MTVDERGVVLRHVGITRRSRAIAQALTVVAALLGVAGPAESIETRPEPEALEFSDEAAPAENRLVTDEAAALVANDNGLIFQQNVGILASGQVDVVVSTLSVNIAVELDSIVVNGDQHENLRLEILRPGGATFWSGYVDDGFHGYDYVGPAGAFGFPDFGALPSTGTYTFRFTARTGNPQVPATGSLVLRVYKAANVIEDIEVDGPEIPVDIDTPGYRVSLRFPAEAGQRVVFNYDPAPIRPGVGRFCFLDMKVTTADGVIVGGIDPCYPNNPGRFEVNIPETRTYFLHLAPTVFGAVFYTDGVSLGFVRTNLPPNFNLTVGMHREIPAACRNTDVRPILLVHGTNGSPGDFSAMRPYLIDRVDEEFLRAGVDATTAAYCARNYVRAVAVGGSASSEDNAAIIIREMTRAALATGQQQVDIVAHSKGGLDSRAAMALSLVDAHNLVMLGTPNGGMRLASLACAAYVSAGVSAARAAVAETFGECDGPDDALWGLTEDFVRGEFNPRYLDDPDTTYRLGAGDTSCFPCLDSAMNLLIGTGEHDGYVPVSSVNYLRSRGHVILGEWDADHGGLLDSAEVMEEVYCFGLKDRGQRYGPGAPEPCGPDSQASPASTEAVDAQSEDTAAAQSEGLLHFAGLEVPANQSATMTLPIGGAGPTSVVLLSSSTGLSATAGSVNLVSTEAPNGQALFADVQSTTNVTLRVTNPNAVAAKVLVLVTAPTAAGLDVQLGPEVAAPAQAVTVTVRGQSTTGLTGQVLTPTGTSTPLTFTASGSNVVATYTPPAAGEYGVAVVKQGATRTAAFRRLAVGTGGARLSGTVTPSLSVGGDGLANALNMDVGVTVSQAGWYTASGTLTSADGTVIGTAEVRQELVAGNRTMPLVFPGSVVYGSGLNGPYHLEDVTLFRDGAANAESRLATTPPTSAYQFTAFRPARIDPGFVTIAEGDSGTKVALVPVTLVGRVNRPVTVNYGSFEDPGWATWPEDYDPVLGTLTFLPGETSKTIAVTIRGDTLDEPNEAAGIRFADAVNATIGGYKVGGATITDDDAEPVIVPGFVTITEGDSGTKVAQVPVTLSAASGKTVTVNYGSFEDPGWATWPEDYDPVLGTLTFLPGQTSKTIAVTIKGDTLDEPNEAAGIRFADAVNATIGGYQVGGATITDDDP